MFYFLEHFSAFMFVEWMYGVGFPLISLEVVHFEIGQKWKSIADGYTVTPSCQFPLGKDRWWWGFSVRKKGRKLKLEKPFCLSCCIEETAFIALLVHMMNISMLFWTVWEVFNEKGVRPH